MSHYRIATEEEIEKFVRARKELDEIEYNIEEILKVKIPEAFFQKRAGKYQTKLRDSIESFEIQDDVIRVYMRDRWNDSFEYIMPTTCLYDENFMEEVLRKREQELAEAKKAERERDAENAKKREELDFKKYQELKKKFEKK